MWRIGRKPVYDGFCLEYEKRTTGAHSKHAHHGIEFHFCEAGDGNIYSGQMKEKLIPGKVTVIYGPVDHIVKPIRLKEYFRSVIYVPEPMINKVLEFTGLSGLFISLK